MTCWETPTAVPHNIVSSIHPSTAASWPLTAIQSGNRRCTICFRGSIRVTVPISPQILIEANGAKMKGIFGKMDRAAVINPLEHIFATCSYCKHGINNNKRPMKLWWSEILNWWYCGCGGTGFPLGHRDRNFGMLLPPHHRFLPAPPPPEQYLQ